MSKKERRSREARLLRVWDLDLLVVGYALHMLVMLPVRPVMTHGVSGVPIGVHLAL